MQEQPGIAPTPLEFAKDILGVELWPKQQKVLSSLVEHRRVAVKSGNGLGKGFCAAVALLWLIHSHKDSAIALSTAPTFRQVRHILWRQVHRLYRPNAELLGGKMLDTRWEISDVFHRFSEECGKIVSFDLLSISGVDLVNQVITEAFLYRSGEHRYNLRPGDSYHGTVAGAAVEAGRCVIFNTGDSDWAQDLLETLSPLIDIGINAFMGVPLVPQDRIVGALAVAWERDPYTNEDQERATHTGNQISGALAGYILERAKQ
jgi:GAF domain-containing protein